MKFAKTLLAIFYKIGQKLSENDREIPHSHTADQPTAP